MIIHMYIAKVIVSFTSLHSGCMYMHIITIWSFYLYSITSDSGCFLFEGNNCHQFKLKYFDDCIKCSIAVLYGEAKNAKEVHCPYPEVLARLRTALDNICALFLPSAQKPVCHLECPLFHNTDNKISPHLPLDEISKEHDVICGIENRMIPKEHYNLFLGLNCKCTYVYICILYTQTHLSYWLSTYYHTHTVSAESKYILLVFVRLVGEGGLHAVLRGCHLFVYFFPAL